MAKCELCGSEIRKGRGHSYQFHKLMFRLVDKAYENWEPPEDPEFEAIYGVKPRKCKETFREGLIIAAGHYDVVFDCNGSPKFKAHSMSYEGADTEKFAQMYKDIHAVVGERLLKCGKLKVYDEIMREM